MGVQWQGMGKTMMEVEAFRDSIFKSSHVLQEFGIYLTEIIQKGASIDNLVDTSVAITAIQVI